MQDFMEAKGIKNASVVGTSLGIMIAIEVSLSRLNLTLSGKILRLKMRVNFMKEEKVIKTKMVFIKLAEQLENVSQD